MKDEIYRNSLKQVYDILQNTENELLHRIPNKFMSFIKDNMNENYQTNLKMDVDIDRQEISKETEAILSLIYRSYWATNKEKEEFAVKDKQERDEIELKKKKEYQGNDIYQVFEERKNINRNMPDNSLMVIKKESFIKKLMNKILRILKKDKQ